MHPALRTYYYNQSSSVEELQWDDGTTMLWDDSTNVWFDLFVAVWILASGVWNDSGLWMDGSLWID
jgi:hypothetical protein